MNIQLILLLYCCRNVLLILLLYCCRNIQLILLMYCCRNVLLILFLYCCRNVGCRGADNVRTCLLSKSASELVDAVPWIQYPSWLASDLKLPPSKDVHVGGVLVNDGVYVTQAPDITLGDSAAGINIPLLIG